MTDCISPLNPVPPAGQQQHWHRARRILLLSLSLLIATAAHAAEKTLLIAPMIGGLDACFFKLAELKHNEPEKDFTKLCVTDPDSPAAVVEATLATFSTRSNLAAEYLLGYTLYVPLLKLFGLVNGKMEIDEKYLHRITSLLKTVDRPVVIYLFSDHFGVDSPVEDMLAKNPENLLKTVAGTMQRDKFGSVSIYPWSFVNLKNPITQLREQAVNSVLDAVCRLPKPVINRVQGVTLLGETHHLYPNFEGGMGFDGDYLISDYSEYSVKGFQSYLKKKYTKVAALNAYLGSSFKRFEDIPPPSKNIRTQPLTTYWDHIDAFAHGVLPVSGWVERKSADRAQAPKVAIYLDGKLLDRVLVAFGRQDVLAAHPTLASADVGWNYNLDFSKLAPGIHNVDVFLEDVKRADGTPAPLVYLATRKIAVVDKSQATPVTAESTALPKSVAADGKLLFNVDFPKELSSYYYNPLAALWHDFRKTQVSDYLSHFEKIAKSKCIAKDKIYSHQILPFVNPGWDVTKYAVGNDLAVPASLNLGISLYGEASYGASFFDWYGRSGRTSYGVTEFHPLKAMDATELKAVFDKHARHNAKFISFFAEAKGLYSQDQPAAPDDSEGTKASTDFTFSRRNKSAGSSVLFDSVREILK